MRFVYCHNIKTLRIQQFHQIEFVCKQALNILVKNFKLSSHKARLHDIILDISIILLLVRDLPICTTGSHTLN